LVVLDRVGSRINRMSMSPVRALEARRYPGVDRHPGLDDYGGLSSRRDRNTHNVHMSVVSLL
jgi:hypothetical protein